MTDWFVPIIVAVITGAFAVITQIILSHSSNARVLAELEKRSEISDVKIEGQIDKMKSTWDIQMRQLTESVNKHNGFAERIPVLEEKIKVMNNRISDLEHAYNRHEGGHEND